MPDAVQEVLNCEASAVLDLAGEADVMICDPPYRAHVHRAATSVGTGGFSPTGKGVHARDLGFDSLGYALRRTIAAFAARVRRWSLIYSDVESLTKWRISCEAAGAEYVRVIPWVRWSQPQLSGDRPPQGWEAVSVFHRTERGAPVKKAWTGYGELVGLRQEPVIEAIEHKCLRGADKHKAEKPLDQMLDLVSWFSRPGELVLDVTAGRGTTGLACKILGRSFVGCEKDPAEAVRAEARLGSALSERDRERVTRYVAGVGNEALVSDKFPPAVARQRARLEDRDRACKWL